MQNSCNPADDLLSTFDLQVNGRFCRVVCNPSTRLLTILRDFLHLTGAKRGCDTGECGACTVILGDRAVRACRVPIRVAAGLPITTIEGLAGPDGRLHPLQQAFLDAGAVQCGFCTPGMIMASLALLQRNPKPERRDIRRALKGNLCRCTGYRPIEDAVLNAARRIRNSTRFGSPIVNLTPQSSPDASSTPRPTDLSPPDNPAPLPIDGYLKTTGKAVFAGDWPLDPATLHAAVVWSAVASGKLQKLDLTVAQAIQGVVRIVTASDIPGVNGLGRLHPHRPLLAADRIRFAGDAVAMVLAKTSETAREAARQIRVQIAPEPPLFDPETALDPSAPAIHPGGNLAAEIHIHKTPAGDGAADGDPIPGEYKSEFRTGFVEHALIEPETATAFYDGDVLTVIAPSQNVFFDRLEVMRILGIPPREFHRVRIRETHTGAAFGKREDIIAQPLAALGTWLTGHPVRLELSRRESFLSTTKRHPMTVRHTVRIGSDDTIRTESISILADTGAYASWAPNILRKAAIHSTGAYCVPHVKLHGRSVYTNNAFAGAMRGFGAVQVLFAAERAMDRIARIRGLDPIEFRKKNAFRPGSTTVSGQMLTWITPVSDLLDAAARALPWTGPSRGCLRHDEWAVGYGAAASFYGIGYGNGIPDRGQVELVRNPDGSIRLYTSAVDYGQGAKTVFARLASETLNVPFSKIQVVTGDTRHTPDSGSTVASRQTVVTGNAVIAACNKLLQILRLNPTPAEPVSIKARFTLDTHPIDPETGQGEVYRTFAVSACTAKVSVHTPTGQVRLHRIVSVHDSGTIIDPVLARSQVTGGVMMGAGMALREEYRTRNGIPLTEDFRSAGIPGFIDVPEMEVIFMPTPDPIGPRGAKGLGEPAMLAAGPAVINAVCDAVDHDFESVPVTPEIIRQVLNP